VPGSTIGLLEVAKGQSLRTLKDQARDRRLRAIDPEELHAMQHAAMHHRHWTTALGTIAYSGELPPEIGIPFINRLDAETDRLWLKAHQTANQQNSDTQPQLADRVTHTTNDLGLTAAASGSSAVRSGAGGSGAGGFSASRSSASGSSPDVSGAGMSCAGGSGSGGSGAGGSGAGGSGPGGLGAGGLGAGGSRAAKGEVRRSVLAAQAFVRMIENGGVKGKAGRADLVIVCDLGAYRRGHAHEGEACHIVGGGPIPVSLVKELGRDAFLKAVLHNGTEIHTIAHFGRRYPAVLRTALDLGAPPEFNGNVCAAPGCDRRYHLQMDHIDPVANGGLTSYDNNQPLCPPDHRIKTERDRKAGLLRGKRRKPRSPQPARAGPSPRRPSGHKRELRDSPGGRFLARLG
ncbi:MAG: HNH endonuclease signature motif containing protein, partial [Actinomycetota bacterium]